MQGIYLKDSHLIVQGKKTAIPAPKLRDQLPGRKLLIVRKDDKCFAVGVIVVGDAQRLSRREFDAQADRHCVSRKDRLRWWADAEPLYSYPLLSTELFEQPQHVAFQPGTKMYVNTDYEIETLDILESLETDSKQLYLCGGYSE